MLLFSLCTDSSKIKVHDTNVNLLGDLFYQHHGQPVKWNNLTTCSEGTRRERKKKNQPIWFSARCKFKSEFSQTITIGRLSKTLNPQLYAWIVFCLICVVLWIKTSARRINVDVNISELHFRSSVSLCTVASSCYLSHARIYSTLKHSHFLMGFRSSCELSVCGRGFYTCRINKVYHILQHACGGILPRETIRRTENHTESTAGKK